MGRKRSTKNRSILTKSLLTLRSPVLSNIIPSRESETSTSDEYEVLVSPPAKTKKINNISHDKNLGMSMSIEWGGGDSILSNVQDFGSPISNNKDQQGFTKVLEISKAIPSLHNSNNAGGTDQSRKFEDNLQKLVESADLQLSGDVVKESDEYNEKENDDDSPEMFLNDPDENQGLEMDIDTDTMACSDLQTVNMIAMNEESENHAHEKNSSTDKFNKSSAVSSGTQATPVGVSLHMSSWNLPESVLQAYTKNGIEYMFPWQKECLLTGNVLNGGNLVYSAPTSAGKTLVAEILMLKRVIDTKKKALYILPFVSVSREKMYSLRDLYSEVGVKVDGFMGSDSPAGGLSAVDIAVCTIEKANSLINRLMEDKNISCLCCIVVDELHMIGDSSRGYLLELLLTKIRFVSSKLSKTNDSDKNTVQLIGMSATLPNLNMLASWLAADMYNTDFRPVVLSEYIKVGNNMLDKQNNQMKINGSVSIRGDDDGIVSLCIETIKEGNSVLIFCPTKNWCEKLAETISKLFSSYGHFIEESSTFKKASELTNRKSSIEDILDQLRNCPVGLDENIGKIVRQSVAFHHAGLTYDERDIIEGAFRRGILRVLVATSTLSSGVNLPAKRVIIRSPMFYGKVLDSLVYKQMSGRAGRKGIDTVGESIIICKPAEKKNALSLLQSDLRPVYSCLVDGSGSRSGYKTMKRALLEVITGGIAVTPEDLAQYEKMTYLHTCLSELKDCDFDEAMGSTIEFLVNNEFITLQESEKEGKRYYPTQLGSACLASSFSPDEAIIALLELRKARKNFCLENELHLIYQVTPIYLQDQWTDLDWYLYYNLWEHLPAQYKDVGKIVGIEEGFLAKAVRNCIQTRTEKQLEILRIHRRFYAALVLQELVNEVPLPVISLRYKINKGMLQNLQNASATFAGMLTVFCHKLGWTCLELLLEQFQSRLTFGVSRELCNLVRISLLSGSQARFFFERGYESVSAIAFANKDDIASLLRESIPFESKQVCNDTKENCRNIWLIGKEGLTEHEAASLIINEAKNVLRADAAALGLNFEALDKKSFDNNSLLHSSTDEHSSGSKKKKRLKRYNKKNNRCSTEEKPPGISHLDDVENKENLMEKSNHFNRETFRIAVDKNSENVTKIDSPCTSKVNTKAFSAKRNENCAQPLLEKNIVHEFVVNEHDSDQRFSLPPEFVKCVDTSVKVDKDNSKTDKRISSILQFDSESETSVVADDENETPRISVSKKERKRSSLLFSNPRNANHVEVLNTPEASDISMSEQKTENMGSSVLFSDKELDLGVLDISSTPVTNGSNISSKEHDTASRTDKLTPISAERKNKSSDSMKINGLQKVNCLNHQLQEVGSSQFINLSNDSMFLLSNSILQPSASPSHLLHSMKPDSDGKNKMLPNVLDSSPQEKANVALKLEDQFNEVIFGEEQKQCVDMVQLNSNHSFDIPESELGVESKQRYSTERSDNKNIESENSIFSEELFRENSFNADDTHCDEFLIIDVASDVELFSTFRKEWCQKKRFSLCFACEPVVQVNDNTIGKKPRPEKLSNKVTHEYVYSTDEIAVVGLAICWGGKDAYYVNLETDTVQSAELDNTTLAPPIAVELPITTRLNTLKSLFLKQCHLRKVISYDMKDQLKILYGLFETLLPNAVLMDPKVAHWVLAPSDRGRNLHGLVTEVLGEDFISILEVVGGEFGIKGLEQIPYARGKSRMRACIEAVLTYNVMDVFEEKLEKEGLYRCYTDVEMPAIRTLTVIEINGIGFSDSECEKLKETMKAKLASIECECYQLARRTFSMTSPDDVSRVLFIELGLPPNGVMGETSAKKNTRNKAGVKRKPYSTSKAVLEKLQKLHRLPKLILEWRRVNSALSKVVYPLQRKKKSALEMIRVYSEPQYHTSTGRVTFSEPNLQNVPREFDIKLPVIRERVPVQNKLQEVRSPGEVFALSIRSIFIPFVSAVFISADYCQLELRLIAHLSGDKKLIEVLNYASDVFKGIAAKINHISIEKVSDIQRQRAKGICYGIIYGMGAKTLAEQLDVEEEDATVYMEQFKDRYCGVKQYIKKTLETTRKLGYVNTLGGRRRYLPSINSSNSYAKSQSERQAINTAVQGSAADLVKRAMNSIDKKLLDLYGYTCISKKKKCREFKGGFLVLQMHDELLYEVSSEEVQVVSEIIRAEMENAWQLSVKLPVRIKVGCSWGSLEEISNS